MLKPALFCVVICDMVSVVCSVILLLSWFRTSWCRADLLSVVVSAAKAGLFLNCDVILFVRICSCSAWKAALLSNEIALARSSASDMLAMLFEILVETGVRVCMVFVLVVVDWCVLVNPSLMGCKLVLDVVLVVCVVV